MILQVGPTTAIVLKTVEGNASGSPRNEERVTRNRDVATKNLNAIGESGHDLDRNLHEDKTEIESEVPTRHPLGDFKIRKWYWLK